MTMAEAQQSSGPTVTREEVRDRYAATAVSALGGTASRGCCGPSQAGCGCGSASDDPCCGPVAEAEAGFGSTLYSDSERAELPDRAVQASLGCGNPLMVADLHPGETVLDLGSGGGIDVL